jgi:hypothetical protein
MADVTISRSRSITIRGGQIPSVPIIPPVPQPPVTTPVSDGIGITINGRNIGGVKRYIQSNEVLDIPLYWQYNVFGLAFTVDGVVNNQGEINLI